MNITAKARNVLHLNSTRAKMKGTINCIGSHISITNYIKRNILKIIVKKRIIKQNEGNISAIILESEEIRVRRRPVLILDCEVMFRRSVFEVKFIGSFIINIKLLNLIVNKPN
jgi:hypothetical protein